MITLKLITTCMVSAGVDRVITDAIKATAPESVSACAKIMRRIGTFALGMFVGDWASKKAAETYEKVAKNVGAIKEFKELAEKARDSDISEEDETLEEIVEKTEKETEG